MATTRTKDEKERLKEIRLISSAIEANDRLGYGPFSNDGKFLKVYSLCEMLTVVGAPYDDSENLFTARMLLLLESKCVLNNQLYEKALNKTVRHYFRDSVGKQTFRPLFLLNDILRYWRTLCLNYEQTRSDPDGPWRKKNINLKFSRMLTVFGTILPILAEQMHSADCIVNLVRLSPQERLSRGLDALNDPSMFEKYKQFLEDYESFLSWKDVDGTSKRMLTEESGDLSRKAASRFSDFIYCALEHKSIGSDMKKYLVL